MGYKSKTKIFGLPLIHISGNEPAVGFIAIGQVAYGFITIAQFGIGIIFGLGQFLAGFFCISQFSFGPILSIGQFSLGWFSIGMFSFGYEGVHLIGYHFVKNNFLANLINNFGAVIGILLYFIIFIAVVFILNLIISFLFKIIKNGVMTIFNSMDYFNNKREHLSNSTFDYKIIMKILIFTLSTFLVWSFLSYKNLYETINTKPKYNKLNRIGKPAVGEVLDIKDLFFKINGNYTVQIKVKVYPDDESIEPYKTQFTSIISRVKLLYEGDRLRLKYNPEKPSEIIWIRSD